MSFYQHKITVEVLIATWGDEPPDINFLDILKTFKEADCLVGSASMSTKTLGILEVEKL